MSCIYKYKGHSFLTELDLDNFLLEKHQLEPKLGDLVFSMSNALANIHNILKEASKDSDALKKKYYEARNNSKALYTEDGEVGVEDPPYIGVNKFLSGLKVDGDLLFPEFRDEEYWKRRFEDWRNGVFNDNEIETFDLDKNNLPKVTDTSQQLKLKETMKNKWQTLAKTGTAIHNIMQLFFSRNKGHFNFEMSDADLILYCKDHVEAENKKYLNDLVYADAVRHGRKLLETLRSRYGENLTFYPEFTVSLDCALSNQPAKLLGILDLIIVDEKGHTHILDYKTSIHNYREYSGPKKAAYSYQLATYQRMLLKYGINTYESDLIISPIEIKNFRRDGDTYIYDGLEDGTVYDRLDIASNTKMWDNIDEFMPAPINLHLSTEDALKTVNEHMSSWFKYYTADKVMTRDRVISLLQRRNMLKPNDDGKYEFYKSGEDTIVATSESEFVDKVTKYFEAQPAHRLRMTAEIKSALREGMKNGIESVKLPSPWSIPKSGDSEWLRSILRTYCDTQWELVDNTTLESFGILTLLDKATGRVDFIRVSTNILTENYRTSSFEKNDPVMSRKGLTGQFETDLVAQRKPNLLMAEAVYGNIELMEAMLVINLLNNFGGRTIGKMSVINPRQGNGITMSNELLYYCWSLLNEVSGKAVALDNFSSGNIKLASKYSIVKDTFKHIMTDAAAHEFKDEYAKYYIFKSATSVLDAGINDSADDQIKALYALLRDLENDRIFSNTLKLTYVKQSELSRKEVELYNDILLAISQLKGVDFKLQLKDHNPYLESINILVNGASGSLIDNPGNLVSDTLNLVTKLTTQAYNNTRADMLRSKSKIFQLVLNLKKEKDATSFGNLTNLYSNLYTTSPDGDFLFKKLTDSSLSAAERDFLEYALNEINLRRYPNEDLETMKNNGDPKYYEVPLAVGDAASEASVSGLMLLLKDKLHFLRHPLLAFLRALESAEGVFNALYEADNRNRQNSKEVIFKMTNLFDNGLKYEKRLDMINRKGIQYFEHNLEKLLMKHTFAYTVQLNMDAVFPMIKAAMIHINMQGAIQNVPFSSDIKYIEDYVKNKIKNESIVNPQYEAAYLVINTIKSAASKLTLAFSPVQALYQPLQGLWTNIKLIITKPDGTNAFTFKHFKKANNIVYKDLFHFGDLPTLCSAINELYGLNDMDMNTYSERISTEQKGFFGINRFAMSFSSRPDYYNRLAIFLSQMMGDGCFEAVSMKDNQLVYDSSKDLRYKAFLTNDKSNMLEYNKSKAMYYAAAQLFVREGAKNPDGTLFELNMSKPNPLPTFYTNQQAESHKSLADDIYGYYSHEKKSMIQAGFLGSLWLQFKTFWSGKKNLYLGSPGIKVRGEWKQLSLNGLLYYYQVNDKGEVLYDLAPTTENTGVPFVQWQGKWQEGVAVTLLGGLGKGMWQGWRKDGLKGAKQGWKDTFNNADPDLRLVYVSNMKWFAYDLFMWIIMGGLLGGLLTDLLKEEKDDNIKNRDFATGCALAAANIAVMSVKNSFVDFNLFDSIGSPLASWTPFAFSWTDRLRRTLVNVATGDEDIWDAIVKTSSAAKSAKPMFDAIKPDMFRTKREGGTFGVE